MHATLPLLQPTDFPPLHRGRLETVQVNVGYRCNQSCVHCHVEAGPAPHRGDEPGDGRSRARFPACLRRVDPRPDRGGAGAARAVPVSRRRRARARGPRHGPLQPHHPRGARAGRGRARRVPGLAPDRGGRVPALLRGGQRRPAAGQGGVRAEHRRAPPPQPPRLRRVGLGSRAASGVQPARSGAAPAAGPRSRPGTARSSGSATGPASTGCSCSPTCRSGASAACSCPGASSIRTWRRSAPRTRKTTSTR